MTNPSPWLGKRSNSVVMCHGMQVASQSLARRPSFANGTVLPGGGIAPLTAYLRCNVCATGDSGERRFNEQFAARQQAPVSNATRIAITS